jgi:alpha-tubulin suppressor-like RCC1 family protein
VVRDGRVRAWGDNFSGQLGNGTNIDSTTPVEVQALTGVKTVAAGLGHSLALGGDGTVWSWGDNASGQLGNGTTADSTIPVQVQGLRGVTAISTAEEHNLALMSSCDCGDAGLASRLSCRCGGPVGPVGTGEDDPGDEPEGAGSVVHAWGENGEGQLGNGATADSSVPVAVTTVSARAGLIAAGGEHSLAG